MIWEINTLPSHWTNVLTSQDSLQNLQDWLGCGSMEGKPATTVRLHEGEGVSQHLAEHRDLTWSPRKQDNSPGDLGKKRGKIFKNWDIRNIQDSLELRQCSVLFQQFLLFHLFLLSDYISLPPLCLFISFSLSVCQPPDAWQSSPTAAARVTFRGEPTDQTQRRL